MALIPPVATGGTLTTFDYCVKLTLQFFFFPHLPPDCSRSITKWKLADITKLTEFKSTSNEFLNAYETDLAFTDDIDGLLVHINALLYQPLTLMYHVENSTPSKNYIGNRQIYISLTM